MFSVYSVGCGVFAKTPVEVVDRSGRSSLRPPGCLFLVARVTWRGVWLEPQPYEEERAVSCRPWKDRALINWEEGEEYFREQLERQPVSATGLSSLAIALRSLYFIRAGEDKSVALMRRSLDAGLTDVSHIRAQLAVAADDDMRVALAQRWQEIVPQSAAAHACIATVYADSRETVAARSAIEQAIALDPDNAEYYGCLASILRDADKLEAALDAVNEAIRLSSHRPDFYSERAQIQYQLGTTSQKRLALQDLDTAERIGVENSKLDSTTISYQRVYIFDSLGDYDAVIRVSEPELEKERPNLLILSHLADFLATCEDTDYRDGERAYDVAKSYQDARGDTLTTKALLAAACAELKDFEQAVALQRFVVEKRKDGWSEDQKRLDCYLAGRAYVRGRPA